MASSTQASQFWTTRNCYLVIRDDDLENKQQGQIALQNEREEKDEVQREQFRLSNETRFANNLHPSQRLPETTGNNLKYWIQNSSWTFCPTCLSLKPEKLLPRYKGQPANKPLKKCLCADKKYIVPTLCLIPDCLRYLSFKEICILRPFNFHFGDYRRLQHGYQQKNNICRVDWSPLSVQQKIDEMEEDVARERVETAYNFLMASQESCYSQFIHMRERQVSNEERPNLYNLSEMKGIECALWPNLYPFTSWCESILDGNEQRLSTKISFYTKVLSSILDYSTVYELLQFHYDFWLFKTISGAISSARRMKCSPARALNAKTFSAGYWKMQHRLLLDAVDQFGYPSLFVTISPYEWSFPVPPWMTTAREITARGPTELAAYETIHIAHILEQLVRGYLCGSNTQQWHEHVFSYDNKSNRSNIHTYYYRFEFQQRGTLHLHLLVWLKNITMIQHRLIRADIPWEHPEIAFLVNKLQGSDKSCLPINNDPSTFDNSGEHNILKLYYPQEAFAINLRAYILTLIPSLCCGMDIQFSDGNAMLLRYVTSYVSKWKDAYSNDALYSHHVTPYQAAYRHLKEMQPCEPEMWLHMSPIKFSWSNSRTKNYSAATSCTCATNKVHQKYIKRAKQMEDMSFLEWLRAVNHTPPAPKAYKQGNTLVSVQYLSPFNAEYFFQHLLMTVAHRAASELYHQQHEQLPRQIQFFASAVALKPLLWNDPVLLKTQFEKQGNKDFFVHTLLSYVRSLHDTLFLWKKQVISTNQLTIDNSTDLASPIQLDHRQNAIHEQIMLAVQKRNEHYDSTEYYCEESSTDDEEETTSEDLAGIFELTLANADLDWRKFILITGQAGTGKSEIFKVTIQRCFPLQLNILLAVPTGLLAATFRNKFGDNITCDTIHSAFHYPVKSDQRPTINWNISNYDLLLLDEISMIPKKIADHVIRTISEITIRPVVVMAGDNQQQQPIETIDRKIVQVTSILQQKDFYSLVYHHCLTKQYRTIDKRYDAFLQHISQKLLDELQEGRILCSEGEPSDAQILQLILDHPDATVLTVSRRASTRINNIVIPALFNDQTPLARIQCDDDDEEEISIYENMRILITQNRDKTNSVVNGQQATIHCIQNSTIFLKLSNSKIVSCYPVTFIDCNEERRTCYPIMPCYALTMCKSQGQTLDKVIIWFDSPKVGLGTGYMALSRIRRQQDLLIVTRILSAHIRPVPRQCTD